MATRVDSDNKIRCTSAWTNDAKLYALVREKEIKQRERALMARHGLDIYGKISPRRGFAVHIYEYGSLGHRPSVPGFADAPFTTFLRQLLPATTILEQPDQFGATFTNVIHEPAEAGR